MRNAIKKCPLFLAVIMAASLFGGCLPDSVAGADINNLDGYYLDVSSVNGLAICGASSGNEILTVTAAEESSGGAALLAAAGAPGEEDVYPGHLAKESYGSGRLSKKPGGKGGNNGADEIEMDFSVLGLKAYGNIIIIALTDNPGEAVFNDRFFENDSGIGVYYAINGETGRFHSLEAFRAERTFILPSDYNLTSVYGAWGIYSNDRLYFLSGEKAGANLHIYGLRFTGDDELMIEQALPEEFTQNAGAYDPFYYFTDKYSNLFITASSVWYIAALGGAPEPLPAQPRLNADKTAFFQGLQTQPIIYSGPGTYTVFNGNTQWIDITFEAIDEYIMIGRFELNGETFYVEKSLEIGSENEDLYLYFSYFIVDAEGVIQPSDKIYNEHKPPRKIYPLYLNIEQIVKNGEVRKDYYEDRLIYNATLRMWEWHSGVDIHGELGAVVRAGAKGTVTGVSSTVLNGLEITIVCADNITLKYKGLDENVLVKAGDIIKPDTRLGYIGTLLLEQHDGPHIHLEAYHNGKYINPNICFTEKDIIGRVWFKNWQSLL